jgi:hypothetical protein
MNIYKNNLEYKVMNRLILFSKNDFVSFIEQDMDKYFANMTKYDLYARKVDGISELKTKSTSRFVNYSTNYIQQVKQNIPKLNKFLTDIGLIIDKPWILSNTSYSYESSLPHTRGSIMFIPEGAGIATLLHERLHIIQRLRPELFEQYFKNSGWTITKIKKDPLQRANPDITDVIYIDSDGNILSELYNSKTPNDISDVSGEMHPNEQSVYEIVELYISLVD